MMWDQKFNWSLIQHHSVWRPNMEASPWPNGLAFPKRAFVYDLVYNPPETALMRAAKVAGLCTTNGLGMLVEQAALSFERWTGQPAPRQAMREAVADNLAFWKERHENKRPKNGDFIGSLFCYCSAQRSLLCGPAAVT